MKKTRRHILGMLVLFMAITFTVQITNTQPVYAAKLKSVKYAKKKLLKKVRSYKKSKYPRNKYIFIYDQERKSKKIVWFYLGISQGDGAPSVSTNATINKTTGYATVDWNGWEGINWSNANKYTSFYVTK